MTGLLPTSPTTLRALAVVALAVIAFATKQPHAQFLRRQTDVTYENYGTEDTEYRNYTEGLKTEKRFDQLGNFLLEGYQVFSLAEARPGDGHQTGSDIVKANAYNDFFGRLVVARDSYRGWSMALTVGDAIKTVFTPLTLNLARMNGARFDGYSRLHRFSLIYQRGQQIGDQDINFSSPLDGEDAGDGNDGRRLVERSPVLTCGGHWQTRIRNRLTLGFTFVNQQQNNVLVSGGDRLRGMLPYDMPQPTTIWVIVRDETPLDGGGVRVSDLRMKASSADGMSRSVTPRRVIRTKLTEPVRNPISGVISSSAAWSPTVPWLPEFDPEINPSITSQDIKQNRLTQMKVFYRTGVVEAPTGIHEIASDELLVYSFELPTDLGVNETVFEGTFSGDYAVMTAQAHTFSFRGTDGDAFIDQRLAPWVVVARANGNVRDGSNTERIEFRHRLATGQSVTGVNAELHLIGVDLWGEYTWNSLYSQYPTSAGKTHVEHRRAWYVNALKRFDHVSFGAELFNIDANYGFGNNSRRGGSVLYNDYSSIQTNSNTIKQDLNDPTGDPYLRGQAYQEFKLVDDNDDRDPWPDDAEQDRPNGTHPNRGVSVGSSDINNDGIADFVQPFLLYDSDPVDFVYGEDFNNNSVVDDRENDDHPDYPYSPDQRGWHAFTRFQWAREGFFTLGTIRVDQPMGGGTSNSNYAKFDFRYADPVIGRLQLIHDSKRVRDTIADHLFETDQDPSKAALESIDPWTRNNRIIATDPLFDNLEQRRSDVHTTWLGTRISGLGWLPLPTTGFWGRLRTVARLNLINNIKLFQNYRKAAVFRDGIRQNSDHTITLARTHKIDWWYEGERWDFQPRLKFQRLTEWHKAEGRQEDRSLLAPIFLVVYELTPDTFIRFGQQGLRAPLLGDLLAARDTDRLNDLNSTTTTHSLLQITNRSEYLGFDMVTTVGYLVSSTHFTSGLKPDEDRVEFFINAIVNF